MIKLRYIHDQDLYTRKYDKERTSTHQRIAAE